MVKYFILCGFMLFSFISMSQTTLSWKVQHPISKKWLKLGEKGSVQEALMASGELPDPFVGDNEKLFSWVENHSWTFLAEFELKDLSSNYYDLDFPSIDTYADVFVNGKLVAKTENAFIHYRWEVKSLLKTGKNEVKIVFTPPTIALKNRLKEVGTVLPAPNDVGNVKVAPLARKPQYQFGWDWALRMVTMGFWEPAQVVPYVSNRVINRNIQTLSLDNNVAKLEFAVQLGRTNVAGPYTWVSEKFGSKELYPSRDGWLSEQFELKNPLLWWPAGMGEQHMGLDHWRIFDARGQLVYDDMITYGVKTVQLLQEKDEFGTSFQLVINGKKVFCKGGDYIPDDIFPARITDELLNKRVQDMADANFNMVRIWGGGMYPKEAFLEACDAHGIMVWQDCMFACAMYPGDEPFLNSVKAELNQQVPRISSHPSVVYWNGNNEVDVAWKNWGFQSTYKLNKNDQTLIETYYQKLFKETIPAVISEYTALPYVHTSPLSNWGKDEFYNHGTQHYWGVWHGKDPIEDFGRKIGRFNAEYGFQSFPEYSTLLSFSDTSQWQLNSKVMAHHQKSYVGNGMIAKHSDLLYGKTTDFKRFVYYSQLTQAEAVGLAITGHRLNQPRCSGTLYWQVNDCWPAPTWSSIDYYGNWKALQYRVKQDFENTAVLSTKNNGKYGYWLVSEWANAVSLEMKAKVLSPSGELLKAIECKRVLMSGTKEELFVTDLKAFENQDVLVQFDWRVEDQPWNSRTFVQTFNTLNWQKATEIKVVELKLDPLTKKGTLILESNGVALDCWVYSLKTGVHFETNFTQEMKGKFVKEFTYSATPSLTDFQFFWR